PHVDPAVYETNVCMAQDYSLRYILVDGQGNFGSIDGDSAAALRYTEVSMTKLAHELLADLEQDTVDWEDNYDGSESITEVLPTRVPNLFI
uniref:DNA gyrase subunit A n=1 Tax=Acinetobacter baumannii TaxID=470 RepID=UPI000B2FF3B4